VMGHPWVFPDEVFWAIFGFFRMVWFG